MKVHPANGLGKRGNKRGGKDTPPSPTQFSFSR